MRESINIKPSVTIGVLNYNGLSFLKETIPALLKLSYNQIEILVLDNGSTDASVEYLDSIKEITTIKSTTNLGYGQGKNLLVKRSTSEFVLLIDNDIVLSSNDVIQTLLLFYCNQASVSFLSVPLIDRDEETTEHYGLYYTSRKRKVHVRTFVDCKPYTPAGYVGGFVFFKKEIFNSLGGYDTIYPFNIDDYDLSARSWLAGYQIYILPMTDMIHIGISTRTNKKSWCWKNQYALAGFGRMAIKNYQLKNVCIWLPLVIIWQFYKSIKASLRFRSICPIVSYFKSCFYLLRDLSSTLEKRILIQKNRLNSNDVFLHIKPDL